MRYWIIALLFCLPMLLTAQKKHKNILISSNYAPNEPTIALDPKNPEIMLAASNIDNFYRSKDGGRTWVERKLKSTFGVWGDPVMICDTASNFYFLHLSNPPNGNWIDRIVCQRTGNYGSSWTNGSFMGLNGQKAQDKQWAVVDRKKNYIYVSWTQFDKYDSADPKDKSSIMFAMSKDKGATWTAAKKINEVDGDCTDSDFTTEGATPAIGINGEVYVAWAGPAGLVFDRSEDEGKTWLDKDILVDSMPGGWDLNIEGIGRANGMPIVACDLSESSRKGTIYINWADQRNGADNADIWLSKSIDKGASWSPPVRVNNDKSNRQQFFTWMTVDQTNGYLYFVFYDRRNTKGAATEVFMARSTDGGQTFENFKISESPFVPNKEVFFGDYTNIVAQGATVRPIWTRLEESRLSIYTAIVDTNFIGAKQKCKLNKVKKNNSSAFFIAFKLHEQKALNLFIYDENHEKVKTIFKNKIFAFGKHIKKIKINSLGLAKGKYTYELKENDKIIKTNSFEKR